MEFSEFVGIIGTGRNGTYALSKILELDSRSEVHHEYNFEAILKMGFLRHYSLVTKTEIDEVLCNSHYSAQLYSEFDKFIDCSNALSWVIPSIGSQFPRYKIVDIRRNGRRVVSSFYNKFKDTMYPRDAVAIMNNWLKNQADSVQAPPPHKKYWRILPSIEFDESMLKNDTSFDRFRFISLCHYWVETNKVIGNDMSNLSTNLIYRAKFEEVFQPKIFKNLAEFLEIQPTGEMFEKLQHPINVHEPINYSLTSEQEKIFLEICGSTMTDLGYDPKEDYAIKY
jgi:hypothetical protein